LSLLAGPGLFDFVAQAETGAPQWHLNGSGTIMKKVALTVAVLALGLAACNKQDAANNTADTNVENAAVTDTNAAANDATANADAALNADVNATNATDANAADANAATNNAQ
jgi:hypothetical protein